MISTCLKEKFTYQLLKDIGGLPGTRTLDPRQNCHFTAFCSSSFAKIDHCSVLSSSPKNFVFGDTFCNQWLTLSFIKQSAKNVGGRSGTRTLDLLIKRCLWNFFLNAFLYPLIPLNPLFSLPKLCYSSLSHNF